MGSGEGFSSDTSYPVGMVRAFIMVETAVGASEDLLGPITKLPQVREAHVVAGDYDIVVEVEGEEVYDVIHAASGDIQGLDGVVDSRTYVAIDE